MQPDHVFVSTVKQDGKEVIQVSVASQDVACVIGGEGKTFRALRSLVTLASNSDTYDVVLDIKE
jgi:predicted RNA-binding protein YlqC (UPF0109 family)